MSLMVVLGARSPGTTATALYFAGQNDWGPGLNLDGPQLYGIELDAPDGFEGGRR